MFRLHVGWDCIDYIDFILSIFSIYRCICKNFIDTPSMVWIEYRIWNLRKCIGIYEDTLYVLQILANDCYWMVCYGYGT